METRIDPAVLSIAEPITQDPFSFGVIELYYENVPNEGYINDITLQLPRVVFHQFGDHREGYSWIIASRSLNEEEQRIAYQAWKSAYDPR